MPVLGPPILFYLLHHFFTWIDIFAMMFEMILLVHTVVGNTLYDRVQSVHTTDLTASSHNNLVPTSTQIPQ